uniref:GRIP domain-containing protein n=1 Tax=Macrostomum lignano TaxID=282301 RepID=A0A1I8FRN7_9PLAT
KTAGVQFRPAEVRNSNPGVDFMVALVEPLATCAAKARTSPSNRKIKACYRVGFSTCSTTPCISAHNKRPYARFLRGFTSTTGQAGLIESRRWYRRCLHDCWPCIHEDWQDRESDSKYSRSAEKYYLKGVLPVISEFVDAVLPLLTNKKYSKYLITGATSLVSVCTLPSKTTDAFKQKYLSGTHIKCKATNSAHEDDELPLGKEFQQHMACFIDTNMATRIRLELRNEKERIEQEILDVKCLQLLRGAVHNEIVSSQTINVPKSAEPARPYRPGADAVNGHQAMLKVLPNLVKPSDNIAREVLNFLAAMLYNGNADVQESMYEYFNSTREEKFFFTMHDRISMSSNSLRE